MSKCRVVQTLVVGPLVSLCLLSGCESGRVVRKDETVRTRSDGTVVREEDKTVRKSDGTVVRTESKKVDRPGDDDASIKVKVDR
jgi:hypothetical protein